MRSFASALFEFKLLYIQSYRLGRENTRGGYRSRSRYTPTNPTNPTETRSRTTHLHTKPKGDFINFRRCFSCFFLAASRARRHTCTRIADQHIRGALHGCFAIVRGLLPGGQLSRRQQLPRPRKSTVPHDSCPPPASFVSFRRNSLANAHLM